MAAQKRQGSQLAAQDQPRSTLPSPALQTRPRALEPGRGGAARSHRGRGSRAAAPCAPGCARPAPCAASAWTPSRTAAPRCPPWRSGGAEGRGEGGGGRGFRAVKGPPRRGRRVEGAKGRACGARWAPVAGSERAAPRLTVARILLDHLTCLVVALPGTDTRLGARKNCGVAAARRASRGLAARRTASSGGRAAKPLRAPPDGRSAAARTSARAPSCPRAGGLPRRRRRGRCRRWDGPQAFCGRPRPSF
jgi:hypothetical protein